MAARAALTRNTEPISILKPLHGLDLEAAYAKYLPFRTLVVYGGVDIKAQIAEIRKGVEFLVATPGRLLDLMNQRFVHLQHIKIFVLDEADRMLDMGFQPQVAAHFSQ